uniref:dolichyl-P-Man:Man5GlcNAc2-PP-dolichol alpha-1,3-mannosyltransferase n=1 Tax=Romanomermis culicivorax TaxID=13658 RepID=A0A915K825_ROMCU
MQQVQGFVVNKSLNYTTLVGQTGPLVYPAGHLYLYTILYYLTDLGTNVRRAQYFFAAFYIFLLFFVARAYSASQLVPPYSLVFMCFTAYRIHSICLLRLFNDPLAMLLFYTSMYFMIKDRWSIACIIYSLAVSVKMNILLFAPGLLVLLIGRLGYTKAMLNLCLCATVQLSIGAPFLIRNPLGYFWRAFDFSRIFFYEWTVNWRFLSESTFVDKRFHVILLASHLAVLILFAFTVWFKSKGGLLTLLSNAGNFDIDAKSIAFVLFSSNFIGIMFSRSLHYQFYVWYFHTLPFLLWSIDGYSVILKLLILGVVEWCWNVFPSTSLSSGLLHICHFGILVGLWSTLYKTSTGKEKKVL